MYTENHLKAIFTFKVIIKNLENVKNRVQEQIGPSSEKKSTVGKMMDYIFLKEISDINLCIDKLNRVIEIANEIIGIKIDNGQFKNFKERFKFTDLEDLNKHVYDIDVYTPIIKTLFPPRSFMSESNRINEEELNNNLKFVRATLIKIARRDYK